MNVQVVGCSHHATSIAIRERLAFRPDQTGEALDHWRRVFRKTEAVLLSTCNRVEVYAAGEAASAPSGEQVAGFLARFHKLDPAEVAPHLYHYVGPQAVRHLFTVAASLDSMVVGEPQILAQVKEAYQAAVRARQHRAAVARGLSGGHPRRPPRGHRDGHPPAPREHPQRGGGRFRPADLRALRRQADAGDRRRRDGRRDAPLPSRRGAPGRSRSSTGISSVPSELARQWNGRARPWEELPQAVAAADLVISTTGAGEPIVTLRGVSADRSGSGQSGRCSCSTWPCRAISIRPSAAGPTSTSTRSTTSQAACQRNRAQRDKELPAAMRIVHQETERFMGDLYHRATGPVIQQLKRGLGEAQGRGVAAAVGQAAGAGRPAARRDPPLVRSAVRQVAAPAAGIAPRRIAARHPPALLLEALARLFQLKDSEAGEVHNRGAFGTAETAVARGQRRQAPYSRVFRRFSLRKLPLG